MVLVSARYRAATALHRLARRIDASADNTNKAEPMHYTIVHSGLDLAEAQRIARKMQVAMNVGTYR